MSYTNKDQHSLKIIPGGLIEKKAWDNYWRRNKDLTIAESSRPDLVIGYVDGYKEALKDMGCIVTDTK